MWNLKYDTNELIYETETDSGQRKQIYSYQRAMGRGGINYKFGIIRYIVLHITRINKVILYSIGNYIQYPVINQNGKEYEKESAYICITESMCCIPEQAF